MNPILKASIDEINLQEEFVKLITDERISKEICSRFKTQEDIDKATYIASLFFVEGAEIIKSAAFTNIEAIHEKLMLSDPDYAERFNERIIKPGKVITLTMEVRKSFGTTEINKSFFTEGPGSVKNDKNLIAGCRVIGIQYYDTYQRYTKLVKDIQDRIETEK